jgi:hypothetical protein
MVLQVGAGVSARFTWSQEPNAQRRVVPPAVAGGTRPQNQLAISRRLISRWAGSASPVFCQWPAEREATNDHAKCDGAP